MTDERRNSTDEEIVPAPDSEIGSSAERNNREQLIRTPEEPRPDKGLGGPSNADEGSLRERAFDR